jgi:hypothetical protein
MTEFVCVGCAGLEVGTPATVVHPLVQVMHGADQLTTPRLIQPVQTPL